MTDDPSGNVTCAPVPVYQPIESRSISTNGEPCNKQRLHQLTMTFFSCRAFRLVTCWKQTQSFRHQPINGTILHWMPTAMVTTSPPKGRACYNVVCHMSGCWRKKWMAQDDWPYITSIAYTMWFNVWNRIAETSICDGWSWLSPLSNVVLTMKKSLIFWQDHVVKNRMQRNSVCSVTLPKHMGLCRLCLQNVHPQWPQTIELCMLWRLS